MKYLSSSTDAAQPVNMSALHMYYVRSCCNMLWRVAKYTCNALMLAVEGRLYHLHLRDSEADGVKAAVMRSIACSMCRQSC